MKKKHATLWAIFLGVISLSFFYNTFLHGLLPAPTDALVGLYHPWRDLYAQSFSRGVPFKNFLITDPVRQQIPWRKLVVTAWKSGHAPGWNPYTFLGTPLNANIQAAPFYPLNILFFVLPFSYAWTFLIILQPLLAGLFMYWYLRNVKRSAAASWFGGFVWAFSGFSISWLTWGTIMQTALWLPLSLLAIEKMAILSRRRLLSLWSAVLAVSLVMTVTAGHAQAALYSVAVVAVYALWRFRSGGLGARYAIVAVFAAIGVSAVSWIPLLRLLPDTSRFVSESVWQKAGWFLPWQHLAQFVAPDFFGNPATLNYWGVWNYGEFIGYVGIIPLIFAVSSVGAAGLPMFFSALMVIAFFFMLPNPISYLPFILHIPLLSVLQPTRLMMVVDISLAVLAAYGLDLFMTPPKRMIRPLFIVGFLLGLLWASVTVGTRLFPGVTSADWSVAKHNLVLPSAIYLAFIFFNVVGVFLKQRLWKNLVILGVLVLVVFDLFRFGWKFTPFTPVSYWFPETPLLQRLAHQNIPGRVMSLDDRILPPNTASYYGIESIEGYDPVAGLRYDRFLSAFESGSVDFNRPSGFNRIYTAHNIDSPLLPYLNVRYVLSLSGISRPFLHLAKTEGDVQVYENSNILPRAFLADRIVVAKDSKAALTDLINYSPEPVGIVEAPIPLLSVPLSDDEGTHVVVMTPDKLAVRVTAVNPRLLVVLNAYNSGWRAAVDGKEAEIIRADYLFTGIVVPPGVHSVVLSYR